MKNNKQGASVLNISIAVMVMLIILSTITFSALNRLSTQKLDNMYNDIRMLKEKVEIYYLKYGKLPILEEYTAISSIPSSVLNINDNDKYYIININALENLTINTPIDEESFFIINEQSHTIYYPKGIKLEEQMYYRLPEEYSKIYTQAELDEIEIEERKKRLILEWTIPEDSIQIQLPVRGNMNITVDWGDGTKENFEQNLANTADFPVHTYATAGVYEVQIGGNLEYFGYNSDTTPTASNGSKNYYSFTQYVSKVKSWGALGYKQIRFC